MGEKIRRAATIILAIVAAIVWGMVICQKIEDGKKEPILGVDYFPMANQHIEWYYPGKPE